MKKMPTCNRAFTLIELLLAISMFSIISLSLYVTFSNGLNLDREAKQVEDVYRESGWVLNTLEHDLQNMVPFYPPERERERIHSFEGTKEKCAFFLESNDGLKQVIYYLKEPDFDHIHKVIVGKVTIPREIVVSSEETRKTKFLVREERDFPFVENEQDENFPGEIEILSRFVEEDTFLFAYAQVEDTSEDDGLVWQDKWEERYPPAALRIQMKLGAGAEEMLPLISRDILIPLGMWGERVF